MPLHTQLPTDILMSPSREGTCAGLNTPLILVAPPIKVHPSYLGLPCNLLCVAEWWYCVSFIAYTLKALQLLPLPSWNTTLIPPFKTVKLGQLDDNRSCGKWPRHSSQKPAPTASCSCNTDSRPDHQNDDLVEPSPGCWATVSWKT